MVALVMWAPVTRKLQEASIAAAIAQPAVAADSAVAAAAAPHPALVNMPRFHFEENEEGAAIASSIELTSPSAQRGRPLMPLVPSSSPQAGQVASPAQIASPSAVDAARVPLPPVESWSPEPFKGPISPSVMLDVNAHADEGEGVDDSSIQLDDVALPHFTITHNDDDAADA